ncbi:MAG: F0F1 ATP synthase subunit B [Gammaproteobacteria bacterium]|nr:F0F1 ATP synthase subunit B [Gammaproteobacteria bacterium]
MNINLTLIGQSIAFFAFAWICMKYVWPPVMKALADREAKIADGLAAAEKGRHDLEQAAARAEEILVKARDKAQGYVTHAQQRADELVEEARSAAKTEGDRQLAAARASIEQEVNEAREKLRGEVAALAVAAAEQILMREVDAARHKEVLQTLSARL